MSRRRRTLSSSPAALNAIAAVVEAIEARRLLAVTITATDAGAGEPANEGAFTLTRDTSTAAALPVSFTVSGNAVRGTDYRLFVGNTLIPTATNTLTIPAGRASVEVTLQVIDNPAQERTETAQLTIVPTADYTVGASGNATVTIGDDDLLGPTVNPASPLSLNTSGNAAGNFGSYDAKFSSDGRYAVFVTRATDVITSPLTTFYQVYRRDLVNGRDELISVSADGLREGNNDAVTADISADGRYIAFETTATNISNTSRDRNSASDVYLRDMKTGSVTLVTGNRSGAVGGSLVDLSDDGRLVLFQTSTEGSKFLGSKVSDTNASDDLFVYRRDGGKFEAVSISSDGTHMGNRGTVANLAVDSFAARSNGDVEQTPTQVIDPETGELIAGPPQNTPVQNTVSGIDDSGGSGVGKAMFSFDGRYVLFPSRASNLVKGVKDGNTFQVDLFVRDLDSDSTEYVTMSNEDGVSANDDSGDAEITADGRYVVFRSNATNLTDDADLNEAADVFVRDMFEDETTLVSKRVAPAGETTDDAKELGDTAGGASITPDITLDGHYIAFASTADDVTEDGLDNNGQSDVFRYEVGTGKVRLVSIDVEGKHSADGVSQDPAISEDGRLVLFTSTASDLPGDRDKVSNTLSTIYLRNVETRQNRVVSLQFNNAISGTDSAADAVFSPDGTRISYQSFGADFGTGQDANGELDTFIVETPGTRPSASTSTPRGSTTTMPPTMTTARW